MTMSGPFLVVNGVPHAGDAPPVTAFLESISGAYTTTRTHSDASFLLFWDLHLGRLADSALILANTKPEFFFSPYHPCPKFLPSRSQIDPLVHESMRAGLPLALSERDRAGRSHELAITALVRGRDDGEERLDAYLHIGFYLPPVVGAGAHLAVAGPGREVATAKYSDWARIRKGMERTRPPAVTELLLSNDGDRILEGSMTNFFVVCRKGRNAATDEGGHSFAVQTAPVSDGILPGVIRQLVIEVCSSLGIPLKEVAPSWSDCDVWEEAFVTSSLRLVQHVETIQAPVSCEGLQLKTWKEISWVQKQFKGPGLITTKIQKEIMKKAGTCPYKVNDIL